MARRLQMLDVVVWISCLLTFSSNVVEGFTSTTSCGLLRDHSCNDDHYSFERCMVAKDIEYSPSSSIDNDDDDDRDEEWIDPNLSNSFDSSKINTRRKSPPPEFTVIENDDVNDDKKANDEANVTKAKKKPPPAFTIIEQGDDDDHQLDDDSVVGSGNNFNPDDYDYDISLRQKPQRQRSKLSSYSEEGDYKPSRRPIRPKRIKTISIENMSGTSWMEKNAKFPYSDNNNDHEKSNFDNDSDNESLFDTGPRGRPGRNRQQHEEGPSFKRKSGGEYQNRNFRDDFRGTRLFVQGIPQGTSWQDLKDHFRLAGEVVFASVSVDAKTGLSKGHGVVQMETSDMAQYAIQIMRDHPLHGQSLFVREDMQEKEGRQLSDSNSGRDSFSSFGRDANSSSSSSRQQWKCANEENASHMPAEDLEAVRAMIKARDGARKRRNFDAADKIRNELKEAYGIHVDDRLKMWWTSTDGSRVPQKIQDVKGDGRWGGLKPWRQIPTTPENDVCVNALLVDGLLKQRDIARREKDFTTADMLLEEARTSPDGDLELRIHDESRTWRVWTDAPPPPPMMLNHGDARKDAAKKSIEIVKEFAPYKLQEVQKILEKFPGREFSVLKSLKKKYIK